eukprot:CAMPEP_0204917158 /NCGR_PEP_ID=MMETSP1397-20131031/14830_1 /ASSEMBLY_ACC=CAM_ASM_000891 /TAXON_ID=49980 /ORGANISM="Climacostomum Climacostomum virens, Strain Stock W-24" /LENGTH=169 /DNA_ID=CAMNT_0052089937 /DNA_START=1 /DNA_END=510 /DNA_ORIENTATION=+
MEARINFYGVKNPYGYFSNFYPSPFTLRDKVWPTTEHYFQAMKYEGGPREELIRAAKTPAKAKSYGRDRKFSRRENWDEIKYGVMREAVLAKFTQHSDLKSLLLDTGDKYLAEHTARDSQWGDGGDGTGQNWLGKILMEVRDELRGEQGRGIELKKRLRSASKPSERRA